MRHHLCTWSVLLLLASTVNAEVFHVTPTGDDTADGKTWPSAKRTVQAGLDAATAGDAVWVAAGTYVERITLKKDVALYGGFLGTEYLLSERPAFPRPTPDPNQAVLDGNQGGSVVTSPSGTTTATRIDGFTITNGNAEFAGGGITCYGSSLTVANNTIVANHSSGYGGGVYCSSSSAIIVNNTISRNFSQWSGGGFYGNSALIANNTITDNVVTSRGGGINCYSAQSIINNTIARNVAYSGGGIYGCNNSTKVANNVIFANSASDGGGIYSIYNATIVNNTIVGNSGGGIRCESSSPAVVSNIIAFNTFGVSADGSSTPSLKSNCVHGNIEYNFFGLVDPTGTNGNISADPKLAASQFGNTHIQPDSPCLDAGNDTAVQAGWVDADGQQRIQGDQVDIGADESDGTTWPAGPFVVVRVSPEGDDAHNGSSWGLAKRTVQAAVVAASGVGGEVWVKAGTYSERITLLAQAHVYGGFAGSEMVRNERDFRSNDTILDGQQGGPVVIAMNGCLVSTIDGCTLRNGDAPKGGGIYCSWASPTIANDRIAGNNADYGGGIYCSMGSSPVTANNAIVDNIATYGGGMYCVSASPPIHNNTITGNIASYGGGLYCASAAAPTMTNNTITGNIATGSTPNPGGGIYCGGSSPKFINTIIAFNSSGICADPSSTPSVRYSCVYGNSAYNYSGLDDPTGTNGNISIDPKIADAQRGNVHIQPDSPCLDTGDDTAVEAGWLDMDSQPRILATHVDIGVDESDGTVWKKPFATADLDNDTHVDADDFALFVPCMSGTDIPYTADCVGADLDLDGDVDQSDFGRLQQCFSGPGIPADLDCTNPPGS